MNAAREIEGEFYVYDYRCEGCGADGEMKVPVDQRDQIRCPEGCGAVYIQWLHDGTAKLTCIVCPIFEDAEDDRVT